LHRAVIRDYPGRLPLYRAERDALEASFLSEAADIYQQTRNLGDSERAQPLGDFSASCFKRAAAATARWTERVSSVPVRQRPPILFSLAWNIVDRQAGV
jgi:hypothetical protein